jgi:hypothetical protein
LRHPIQVWKCAKSTNRLRSPALHSLTLSAAKASFALTHTTTAGCDSTGDADHHPTQRSKLMVIN